MASTSTSEPFPQWLQTRTEVTSRTAALAALDTAAAADPSKRSDSNARRDAVTHLVDAQRRLSLLPGYST
jgi:hypothetical protein